MYAQAKRSASFISLAQTFLAVLAAVRLNTLYNDDSVDGWRACSWVHVLEAVYAWQVYHSDKPFPLSRAEFVFSRHGGAAVIFAGIFFNALLFTGIWLYKEWHPEELYDDEGEFLEEEGEEEGEAEEAAAAGGAKKTN